MRDELAEATEDIKHLTGEVTSLAHSLNEQQGILKSVLQYVSPCLSQTLDSDVFS